MDANPEPDAESRKTLASLPSIERPATQRLIVGASAAVAIAASLSWWMFTATSHDPAVAPRQLLLQVDLNTAAVEELCLLPKIGPVAAQAIIAERTQQGNFDSIDEVAQRVRGIGPKTVEAARPYIVVTNP